MLEQITCPADLRRLSYDQLNSLSSICKPVNHVDC